MSELGDALNQLEEAAKRVRDAVDSTLSDLAHSFEGVVDEIHKDDTDTSAPAEAPVEVPAGDVANPDGSVTHADGTVTRADGVHLNADGTPVV
jgi:hypothetical protein